MFLKWMMTCLLHWVVWLGCVCRRVHVSERKGEGYGIKSKQEGKGIEDEVRWWRSRVARVTSL